MPMVSLKGSFPAAVVYAMAYGFSISRRTQRVGRGLKSVSPCRGLGTPACYTQSRAQWVSQHIILWRFDVLGITQAGSGTYQL